MFIPELVVVTCEVEVVWFVVDLNAGNCGILWNRGSGYTCGNAGMFAVVFCRLTVCVGLGNCSELCCSCASGEKFIVVSGCGAGIKPGKLW